jgi:N-acetyltransferase
MTKVPVAEDEAAGYIALALTGRDAGTAAPFAVVRLADEEVIGSTRLWDLQWWPWPEGHPRHGHEGPDTAEIGHTWLAKSAIRTGANTEMKRLMLTHAFETWDVECVCFHTDARNERSAAAIERIGGRFEGVLRSHRLATDLRPRDSARYSITAAEWPAVRSRLAELAASRAVAS